MAVRYRTGTFAFISYPSDCTTHYRLKAMGKTVKNEKVYIKSRTVGITAKADRKDGEGERFVPGSREWKRQATLSMVKNLFYCVIAVNLQEETCMHFRLA